MALGMAKKLRARLITPENPGGDLDINYLKMAQKLLAWLVLEEIVVTENLLYKHVGFFSNNTSVVSWKKRGPAKKSAAAGCLIRVSALRQRVARALPLVAAHLAVYLNVLGSIPYCSFAYSKQ